MAIFRNTFYAEHQPTSPNESWGPGASRMTRTLRLVGNASFTTRYQAAVDILGYSLLAPPTGGAGAYIHRVIPMSYPSPGIPLLAPPDDPLAPLVVPPESVFWAVGISKTAHKGVGGIDPTAIPTNTIPASYNESFITVEFSTLTYFVVPDVLFPYRSNGGPDEGLALSTGWVNSRYITRQIQPFSRLIKIPYGMMWNVGGPGGWNVPTLPKNTKTGLPVRDGGANVSYIWHQVPLFPAPGGVNWQRVSSALGGINDAAFDFAPAGTMLLDNVGSREYQGAFGERYADITFNMIYLPHHSTGLNYNPQGNKLGTRAGTALGWNYIFDIVNGIPDYYYVTADRAGLLPPFQSFDFSSLFRP